MMLVTATGTALLLVLLYAPDTPLARALHALVVVPLAARLQRIRRRNIVFLLVVVLGLCLLDREGMQIVAMGMPDVAMWLSVVDVATLADVAAALIVTVAVAPRRSLTATIRAVSAQRGPRRRARRTPARLDGRAANDDDADPARRAA